MKLMQGKKVEEKGMAWAKHYSDAAIRRIGAAEVAGALGLILPAVTGVATWLVPVAAIGLVVLVAGAVRRHLVIGEGLKGSMQPLVLGVLALIVAVGRIGVAPF
ncbi:MAG TPA: DoxX family protein [Demequina sp.]|nr:DoxX family protein [Demequina sp.]